MHDKLFNIAKNPKYDGYEHRFASMVYNLLGKKSATYTGTEIYSENQQLAEELHKLIIRKFKKVRCSRLLRDNIWCANLANIQ